MKNATKFIGLVMLLVSSISFAFGQSGANKMTLEQKIAYDNSVVVKQEAPVEEAPETVEGKTGSADLVAGASIIGVAALGLLLWRLGRRRP